MTDSTTTSLLDQVCLILEKKYGIAAERISSDTVLESLDLDSLALIELIIALRKRFSVVIQPEDVTPDNTVGELAEYISTSLENSS